MKVSGIDANTNVASGQMKPAQAEDNVSRSIRRQIEEAQKQLQDIASNEKMPIEEKMKKRQELQKQISDLNNQLRQHQLEQRKEEQEKKRVNNDAEQKNNANNAGKEQQRNSGMSKESMEAIISSEYVVKQSNVHESVAKEFEGQAKVVEAEIRIDASRSGTPVKGKQEKLAELEEKAQTARGEQFSKLKDANSAAAEGTKQDKEAKTEAEKEAEKKKKDEQLEKQQQEIQYTPVDVRL